MRNLHWFTLIGGIALGYFVVPPVVAIIRSKMA